MIDIKQIGALKVVELKEKLEALGLPANGLKADLVERLKEHYEKSGKSDSSPSNKPRDASPKAGPHSDAELPAAAMSMDHAHSSPKSQPQAHPVSPKHKPADASPKHKPVDASPKQQPAMGDVEMPPVTEDSEGGKPSAADLAKKRAERFGIPLVAKSDEPHGSSEPSSEKAEHPATEPAEKKPNPMEKYAGLIASSLEEGSIIVTEDLTGDSRNANLLQKVIEHAGEDKVKEIVREVVAKICTDFENDRSKIESPPRLAGFRISRALKNALPKLPRPEKQEKKEDKPASKDSGKKDSWKGKWTDEEWAEWNKKKEESGGWKKKDWGDWKKGSGDWKSNDWNSGDKRKNNKQDDGWGSKKKKNDAYDAFESDVEEFIYRNRLDNKAAKILREETKGMVTFVMDQGFDLKRYDNPSREVMLRCKDYMRTKRGDRSGKQSASYSARSRSRSRSRSYHNRSRSPVGRGGADRSPSRGRSLSRSNSRDRYRDRSRSPSV